MELERAIAEAIAEKYTRKTNLADRKDDWSYGDFSMGERVSLEVDSSYRAGSVHDSSLVMRSPTSLQLAEVAMEALKTYLRDGDVLSQLEAELDYEGAHGTSDSVVNALLRTAEGGW